MDAAAVAAEPQNRRAIIAVPGACGGIGRRARLRALSGFYRVEVRVLSGALKCDTKILAGVTKPLGGSFESIELESGSCWVHGSERGTMETLLVFHEVDDVDHWLGSPKREEFFGPLGITVRTFRDPGALTASD
jgi:hypothetical protein